MYHPVTHYILCMHIMRLQMYILDDYFLIAFIKSQNPDAARISHFSLLSAHSSWQGGGQQIWNTRIVHNHFNCSEFCFTKHFPLFIYPMNPLKLTYIVVIMASPWSSVIPCAFVVANWFSLQIINVEGYQNQKWKRG